MTKQEQLEEIKQVLIKTCKRCRSFEEDYMQSKYAEALYNAGYRKIMNGKELNSEPDEEECDVIDDYTIGFATYLMQKRRDEVDRMQAEIKRLEKENAYLLKACEEQFTFDTTEGKKYSIFDSVRKEFADEVKAKLLAIFGKTICSDLDTEDITDIIDELLEEYGNAEDKS